MSTNDVMEISQCDHTHVVIVLGNDNNDNMVVYKLSDRKEGQT